MPSANGKREERRLINRILDKVRRGARIRPLARRYGIKPDILYCEAKRRGIKLCSGYRKWINTPQEAAQYLNREFGRGASTKFRKLWFTKSLVEIGAAFDRSHQWAFEVGRVLFRGAPKPNPQRTYLEEWAANGFLICLEILASRGVHEQEAAKLFGVSREVIRRQNRRYRLGLETDALRRSRQYAALHECVTTLRKKGFSIGQISGILRHSEDTIRNFECRHRKHAVNTPPLKRKRAA